MQHFSNVRIGDMTLPMPLETIPQSFARSVAFSCRPECCITVLEVPLEVQEDDVVYNLMDYTGLRNYDKIVVGIHAQG